MGEKYFRKKLGVEITPARASKFWRDVPNERVRKVTKFDNDSSKVFFSEKLPGGDSPARLTGVPIAWGDWGFLEPPPISGTTKPILKFRTGFDRTAKFVERNFVLLTTR